MEISKRELDQIIKEEIDTAIEEGWLDRAKAAGIGLGSKAAGAFGAETAEREMAAKAAGLRDKAAAEKAEKSGRRDRRKAAARGRKAGQTYPATELTALAATLRNVATKSGVPFPGGRGNMVTALEKVLSSVGYVIDEAKGERVFIGQEGNIEISAESAPVFVKWLSRVKEKAPDVYASLASTLGNYRFDVPAELAAAAGEEEIPPISDAGDLDPDAPDIPAGEVHLDTSDEEEDVAIELDPEGGDTEIDLTDEPAAGEPPAEEEETVALYKGKGGVSLQSFIDRLGGDDPEIKGVVRSTILKHIANQMKKQNVQVVQEEEAGMAYRMIAEEFISSLDEAAVAIYNHPAGKQHSLNAALQKLRADGATGIEKEKLGKLLDALARWAKSQGLKVNEEIENSVTRHLDERFEALTESKETQRWRVLSGVR